MMWTVFIFCEKNEMWSFLISKSEKMDYCYSKNIKEWG